MFPHTSGQIVPDYKVMLSIKIYHKTNHILYFVIVYPDVEEIISKAVKFVGINWQKNID